jgi:hypothetical protein
MLLQTVNLEIVANSVEMPYTVYTFFNILVIANSL